jgi:phospholipid transport system substrate-binding protein
VEKAKMKILGLLTFIILVMHIATPYPSASDQGAIEVIERLHTTLLAVMKEGDQIGYQGRYDRLAPVIKTSFDMPFISKTVLGKYWETFNNEQRSRFVEAFTKMSIATYAANFDRYSGERFKMQLDYLVHRTSSQWRIINIIAEGVSDLALKRADYSAFLKNKGFEALIEKLNEKVGQYSR